MEQARAAGVQPLTWARRQLWKSVVHTLPLVPSRGFSDGVRHRLINVARSAPLELCIARGDTVVLVGAVPQGELWEMARLVGSRGRAIAVEPFPDHIKAIEERARRLNLTNVSVIPVGAWAAPGRQTLYIHPQLAGSHIVLDSGTKHDRAMPAEQYAGAIEIEVDTLDNILARHGITECDFIKITVMGAELQVLQGMENLLSTTPKLWVKAHALIDGQPANVAISKLLMERGYRTVIVRGNVGPSGKRAGDVYASRT
jgi:FkbM family methyltransferase